MITPEHAASADSQDGARLANQLQQALQGTIFSSTLRIAPRRVRQIADEFAAVFRQFAEEQERSETVHAYGRRLATDGVGHQAILALTDVLHRECWAPIDPAVRILPVSVRYSSALLAGYMAGREAHLLQEQERTRQALERARTPRAD
jgi:hypothetical protein